MGSPLSKMMDYPRLFYGFVTGQVQSSKQTKKLTNTLTINATYTSVKDSGTCKDYSVYNDRGCSAICLAVITFQRARFEQTMLNRYVKEMLSRAFLLP